MKQKIFLMFALLCAVVQGAWSQNYDVWDGVTTKKPSVQLDIKDRWNWTPYVNITSAAELAYVMKNFNDQTRYDYVSPQTHAYCSEYVWKIQYRLAADVDMTAGQWIPLGTNLDESEFQIFRETFDGQGHSIKIKISDATANYQGLFAKNHGLVASVHLDADIHCKDSRLVGGIAGENYGTIENCKVSGTVKSDWHNAGLSVKGKVGGICGENNYDNNSTGVVQYCCVTADVTNNDADVGGLVGCNDHSKVSVKHCTFYGTVNSTHSQDSKYVGHSGKEENLYDTFNLDEYNACSGRALYQKAIKYPYTVTVKTVGQGTIRTQSGGEYDVPGAQASTTFTLNVTSGTVQSVTLTDADGNNVSLQGHANDNSSYWFVMPKREVFATVVFWGDWPKQGAGTEGDPYLITSASDWNNFARNVTLGRSYSGKYVKLTNNISVSTMAGDNTGYSFQGTFDGDGHTMTLNLNEHDRAIAPFRYVNNATIKNLKTGGSVTGNYTGNSLFGEAMDLSGIVGWANGTTTIENCISSVAITSNRPADVDAGGIVAHVDEDQTINLKGCVFDGSITYSNANGVEGGGLIGWLRTGAIATVKDCLFAPSAISINDPNSHYTLVCGTTAAVNAATITGCYYTRPLGTAQGSQAIFTTYAPSALGSLVKDYGMVKAYENALLFDGKYYFAPTLGTGSGTEGDPFVMSNASQWDTFVYDVDNYDNYSGKYVLLAADISVSTMVGSSEERSFQGTFLGNNHTITFTKGTSGSAFNEESCAPFRFTKNATIQDLKVAGDIYTSNKLAAGLASRPYGTTIITNCHVSTVIHSSKNGDGAHGGIVAMPSGTLSIEGCAYTGRLLTNNGTNNCGGFVGWFGDATISISNSLYNPSSNIPEGWTAINAGATFVRGSNVGDNCYYTETLGTAQGTKAYTLTTAPTNLGSLVQDYGTLEVYQNGLLYDGTYYVPLTLSGAGTEASPYIIGNAGQWNDFATYVTNGYKFSGQFVKLNADIEVSTMAGADHINSFQGTFDGDGHTLTFTKGTSESPFNENYCAPFRHVKNAIITNLHVTGTIYTSAMKAAGFVGESHGALTITGCRSSVAINSSKEGDGTHGGFVATLSGANNDILIDGCVFDGSFNTTNGTVGCGGFIGWGVYNKPTIKNSLMKPSSVAASMLGNTFARWYTGDGGIDEPTIDNCYYVATTNLPTDQGLGYSFASAPANIGTAGEAYTISGITPYTNGLLYDGRYYMTPEAISLANTGTNDVVSIEGYFANVTLTDRTLYKDGKWNTICLPFNVTLAGSPLAGATARPLTSASISGTTLNLTFGDAVTTLTAGTPYIIKWAKAEDYINDDAHNILNPIFTAAVIDKTDRSFNNAASDDLRVRFAGTYKSLAFDSENRSILLMGGANTLYYPNADAGLGAQRAYIKIGDDGGQPAQVKAFNIDFGDEDTATGVIEVNGVREVLPSGQAQAENDDSWYSLDGRKLGDKPTMRGIYVNNGHKVVIK